jgi:hypothetical protein
MGLDLAFLVVDGDPTRGDTTVFAHTTLDSRPGRQANEALFRVEKDSGRDVPELFFTYLSRENGHPCYGNTQTTPYGEKLRMVRARELLLALSKVSLVVESPRLLGAVAYMKALPGDTWVALYWH